MVSLKLDLGVMIGNHRVNMPDYMIHRHQWKMAMKPRARRRLYAHIHTSIIYKSIQA